MSVIAELASRLNRRDEEPNVELARRLASLEDRSAIKELADQLPLLDKEAQSDCIKVLYVIGSMKPELIETYTELFLKLLTGKNNRLVWGAMMALATVADRQAEKLYSNITVLYHVITNGSVITVDHGIKVLVQVAGSREEYRRAIFPFLLHHLETCRPKEVPQHAESIRPAVDETVRQAYLKVLKHREPELSKPQLARVVKLYKSF